MSDGLTDALMYFDPSTILNKNKDEEKKLLDEILDEDTQEIVKDPNTPDMIYDPRYNKFVRNIYNLKCTCGAGTVYAGHSDWCELITLRKDK